MTDDGGQRSEGGDQKSEIRGRSSEIGKTIGTVAAKRRKRRKDAERQWTGVKRESTVRGFRSGTI